MTHGEGSVVLDKRSNVWNHFFWEHGKRHSRKIGTLKQYPNKKAASRAVQRKPTPTPTPKTISPQVSSLIEGYRNEKMPTRTDTRRSYESWIRLHIVPKFGDCALSQLQARPVELWLDSLTLSPKSKAHIRGLLSTIWDYAMWRGDVPTQRNPMELVTVKGSSKRTRQPRSLTVEEFQSFVCHLEQPFNLIALLCVSLGLRISEALALKWSDVDWLGATLRIERGIVMQKVDTTKTAESRKQMSVDAGLLEILKSWKQSTQFNSQDDWIFASPFKLGKLPWSYPWVWNVFRKASSDAGIGTLATHTMRHTFRSWLDSVGTPVGIMQKLMRHADVRTTMQYGDAFTEDMAAASGKVAGLALNGR